MFRTWLVLDMYIKYQKTERKESIKKRRKRIDAHMYTYTGKLLFFRHGRIYMSVHTWKFLCIEVDFCFQMTQ